MSKRRGFTLIELLIVIAIIAILSIAVVVVLNPVEMLKQARDATRLSDFAAINSIIPLLLVESGSFVGTWWYSSTTCTAVGDHPTTGLPCSVNASTTINGSGWITVDFTGLTGGSPLARLPLDPVNDVTNFYAWRSDVSEGVYGIYVKMESERYDFLNNLGVNGFYAIGSKIDDW